MAGSSRRVARRVAVKTWHAKALELRIAGLTVREIASRVKKAPSTVHEAIETELAAIPAPGVVELRELQGSQLDALVRGHMPKARKGDAEAAHVVIAAIRQKAKLFGTEKPTRTEHTGRDGAPIATLAFDLSKLTDDQLERLIAGDASVLGGGAEEPSEG